MTVLLNTAPLSQEIEDVTVDVDAGRAWVALRANLKEELLAPVAALLDYSEMLVEEAQARGCEHVLADLQALHECGLRVREVVERILDSSAPPPDEKEARHALYNPLNPIVQYCEMLLEDARDVFFLDAFVPDLRAILGLANHLLRRVGDLFTFPRPESAPPAAVAPRLPPRLAGKAIPPAETGAVLVVDDNPINRNVLCRRLEREGHRATGAGNGRIALRMIRERPIDLVLLDVLMPEMSGFETLEELKADARLCHVPVIMISALDEIDSAVRCIELGAEDYLTKPCNQVLLRARIGACLEKKRLRDREVEHRAEIERAKERVDELLHVILPRQIVPELIATGSVRPRCLDDVAVLFADVVGFTPYCCRHPSAQVVDRLQRLVEAWEDLAPRHGILKIKTIGDAFMAACGLLEAPPDEPVSCCIRFGREMIAATRRLVPEWSLRVGIDVGPVVAGVVGRRQYLFDLWGDTVNTAARMEAGGVPDAINLSPAAWARVAAFAFGRPNPGDVKGIGWTDMVLFGGFVGE